MDILSGLPILIVVGIFVGAGFIVLHFARKQNDERKENK